MGSVLSQRLQCQLTAVICVLPETSCRAVPAGWRWKSSAVLSARWSREQSWQMAISAPPWPAAVPSCVSRSLVCHSPWKRDLALAQVKGLTCTQWLWLFFPQGYFFILNSAWTIAWAREVLAELAWAVNSCCLIAPIKRERFLLIRFYKGSSSTRRVWHVIHCAIKAICWWGNQGWTTGF